MEIKEILNDIKKNKEQREKEKEEVKVNNVENKSTKETIISSNFFGDFTFEQILSITEYNEAAKETDSEAEIFTSPLKYNFVYQLSTAYINRVHDNQLFDTQSGELRTDITSYQRQLFKIIMFQWIFFQNENEYIWDTSKIEAESTLDGARSSIAKTDPNTVFNALPHSVKEMIRAAGVLAGIQNKTYDFTSVFVGNLGPVTFDLLRNDLILNTNTEDLLINSKYQNDVNTVLLSAVADADVDISNKVDITNISELGEGKIWYDSSGYPFMHFNGETETGFFQVNNKGLKFYYTVNGETKDYIPESNNDLTNKLYVDNRSNSSFIYNADNDVTYYTKNSFNTVNGTFSIDSYKLVGNRTNNDSILVGDERQFTVLGNTPPYSGNTRYYKAEVDGDYGEPKETVIQNSFDYTTKQYVDNSLSGKINALNGGTDLNTNYFGKASDNGEIYTLNFSNSALDTDNKLGVGAINELNSRIKDKTYLFNNTENTDTTVSLSESVYNFKFITILLSDGTSKRVGMVSTTEWEPGTSFEMSGLTIVLTTPTSLTFNTGTAYRITKVVGELRTTQIITKTKETKEIKETKKRKFKRTRKVGINNGR